MPVSVGLCQQMMSYAQVRANFPGEIELMAQTGLFKQNCPQFWLKQVKIVQ